MPSESMAGLIAEVKNAAADGPMPIDEPVYEKAGRDPGDPILFAGNLDAPVCFVGRDLGKDEVAAGQPLIGAAGKLVRLGLMRAHGLPTDTPRPKAGSLPYQEALDFALLTNTVPFKPPGNKAYAETIRRRFRPFLERLLAVHWTGHHLITLGSEAFGWFEPYADPAEWAARARSEVRFESSFACRLPSVGADPKPVTVYPLPHPSPLNRRWYDRFPELLDRRLAEILPNANESK